jgi:diaminopropionate ammonia-lyase
LESARAKKLISLPGPFDTIMAGLRCGEVSPVAWPTIAATVDAFVAIDDEWSIKAMRKLAHPANEDPQVVAGAAGACGLAALLAIIQDETLRPLRAASGLNEEARVFLINTEGATDPELYGRITEKQFATKGSEVQRL